jgi:hypothetical protein
LMGAALILLAVISVALMVIRMQGRSEKHHHAYIYNAVEATEISVRRC